MRNARHGYRYRRLRLETLDITVESHDDAGISGALAILQASRAAGKKRAPWVEGEPLGHFLESDVVEYTKGGSDLPSHVQETLAAHSNLISYMLIQFDRMNMRGRVVSLGRRIRKTNKDDVSMTLDVIQQLMKAIGITEVVLGDDK